MSDCLMPVTVQLDGIIDSASAFHDPKKRWNGAICPWFTQEVALKILEKVNGFAHKEMLFFFEKDKTFVEVDSEKDTYVEYEGKLLDTPFERTILYPIGNCYWMWDVKEDSEIYNNPSDSSEDAVCLLAKLPQRFIDLEKRVKTLELRVNLDGEGN